MTTAADEQVTAWRPTDSLANRLRLMRAEKGLSQREAADVCGIGYGAWQGMEDGREARSLNTKVARISMALGVDRDWLMWGGPLTQESPHPAGPDGGNRVELSSETAGGGRVRRQGLEPRTRWLSVAGPADRDVAA